MSEERPSSATIIRAVPWLLALAFLAWNVAGCLLSALSRGPLWVWRVAGLPVVAVPGIPVRAEAIRPGTETWWALLIIYGSALVPLALIVVLKVWFVRRERAVRLQQLRHAARREALGAPVRRPPPLDASAPARVHLVDVKVVRSLGSRCLIAWGAVGGMVLLLALTGGDAAESWASVLYLAIYGVGFVAVWLGFRHAFGTVAVFTADGMRVERHGRQLWALPWSEVTGWWRELGGTGNLKAIAVRARGGTVRRINVGWIGLMPEAYGALFAQLRARSGREESTPVQVERDIRQLSNQVVIGLLALVVIVAVIVLLRG